jgi:hypothetical protein
MIRKPKSSVRVKINYRFKKDKGMKVALIGSERYETRGELKEMLFKLKQKYADDLIIISRGNQDGIEKWVRKFSLEMGIKYIEYNPAHTPMNLYSGMTEEYYEKPFHPTQKLHQYDTIVWNADKIIYFGEIPRSEFNHFKRVLERNNKKATFIQ